MNKRGKMISYGDKIFARVSKNGRTVINFVTEKVATISELIAQLRAAVKDLTGLVIIKASCMRVRTHKFILDLRRYRRPKDFVLNI